MTSSWPKEIYELAKSTFGNPKFSAYGQIATVDSKNQPSVRTVHFHLIEQPTLGLLVNTNIQSQKWSDLKKNPKVSGCFWNTENQIQIRFDGIADLITEKNKDFKDLIQKMWLGTRAEVRTAYLLDDQGLRIDTPKANVDPEKHSKNHGLVIITPTMWDIFENNSENYRFGKRWIYKLKKNEWKWREVNSLHER